MKNKIFLLSIICISSLSSLASNESVVAAGVRGPRAEELCSDYVFEANVSGIADCDKAIHIIRDESQAGKKIIITFSNHERLELVARKTVGHFAGGLPITPSDSGRPGDRLVLGAIVTRGKSDFQRFETQGNNEIGAGVSYRFTFGRTNRR